MIMLKWNLTLGQGSLCGLVGEVRTRQACPASLSPIYNESPVAQPSHGPFKARAKCFVFGE